MLTGSNDAGMVTNDGSLSIAAGGTLDVTASVDPLSNGLSRPTPIHCSKSRPTRALPTG
jgi:hypothetical protein